jgi:serine/threonine protein kinase
MFGTSCPSRERLFAYLVGGVEADEAEELIAHASGCFACQATLAALEDSEDTLIGQLRRPAQEHGCLQEPECREALARAEALAEAGRGAAEAGRGKDEGGSGRPPPDPQAGSPPSIGQLGEYRLLGKLGQGGMGTVYKARHTELDRVVALKVLPMGRLGDDRAVARFRREMQALGRLDHPHIVRALDAREIQGTRFLVMEYLDGLDLSELVQRLGPLPIADACELVRQAALGLQYAHQHGLVHRDVKPSNLMLGCEGQVKLLDLGLARFCAGLPAGKEMTGAGQTMGTADYMAPEQVSDSHKVDIRADVYSLGCTLYKLLSGHAPFSGAKYKSSFAKMTAHVREPVPPIRDSREEVPDELAGVLDRMLAKDPAQRYATPGEVADAVGQSATGCDLSKLWARAREKGQPLINESESGAATPGDEGSAQVATQPSEVPEPRTARAAARRWKALAIVVGLMVFGLAVGLALEIIIRIRRDGQETTLHVPDGSEVVIDLDGKGTTPAARGPRPTTRLVYREDFAGPGRGVPTGWKTAWGLWEIRNGALAAGMPEKQWYHPAVAFAPAAAWRDYAVECEMRLDRSIGGVVFRHDEDNRFYAFQIQHQESGGGDTVYPVAQFLRLGPNRDPRVTRDLVYAGDVFAQKEYELSRGEYHRIRVEVKGSSMSAFVDGLLVLEAEDRQQPIPRGGVGLIVHDARFNPPVAFFRNLHVEQIGEVAEDQPPPAAEPLRLVAAWEFDEGQGTTAHDSSGNGNDAVLQGGVRWVAGRDKEGRAVALNGTDGFLRAPNHPSQSGMKQLTVRALFKLHSLPKGAVLVRKWGPGELEDDSFTLDVEADGRLFFLAYNGTRLDAYGACSKPVPLDTWVETAAVYDGLRNALYVRVEDGPWAKFEGFLMPSQVRGFEIRDTDEPIEIGCDADHKTFLNATIDWVRIYAGAQPPTMEPQ